MEITALYVLMCALVANFLLCSARPEQRQRDKEYVQNRRRDLTETYNNNSSSTNEEAMRYHDHKNHKGRMGDHTIVFPDSQATHINMIAKAKPRKCLSNVCEEVDEYPADYIRSIISRTKEFDDFFSNVKIPNDIADRLRPDSTETQEQPMCQTKSHVTYPQFGKNTANSSKIIINVDGYFQALVYETCLEGASCKFSEIFPNDYVTSCKQRYSVKRLVAMDEINNKPGLESFEVPSCCVCTYRSRNGK